MNKKDQTIFKELLSDTRFVEWASGRDVSRGEYWDKWKAEHPESVDEFEEAYKAVSILKVDNSLISDNEISYLWDKVKNRIQNRFKLTPFQKALLWYGRVAGVLIIPLLIVAVWYFRTERAETKVFAQGEKMQSLSFVTLKAPPGGKLDFILPDSSVIWLNSGSEIKYPVKFNNELREVSLKGEAVFNITKSKIPFVVHNAGPDVKVYGTVFSINSYDDENDVVVALLEGKIALQVNSKEVFIKPGEVSVFDKSSRKLDINHCDNVDQYLSWREDKLIFRNAPLKEIIKRLQHNYNVSITLSGSKIADYKYNATFHDKSLDQILYMLTLTSPIRYKYIRPALTKKGEYTKAKVIIFEDKSRVINQ